MAKSKYNVDSDKSGRTYEDIVFASQLEMRYYRDVVLPGVKDGSILHFELQKKYVLQPKFHNGAKSVQPIYYVADFYIEYADGSSVVIDTKGCPDSVALMKRKMFWYHYPETKYKWITYVKKYGGWIDYEYALKCRKEAKKARAAAQDDELKESLF